MASRPLRLIIGLDYGTTFTGINYGVAKMMGGTESLEEFIFSEWPGGGHDLKVPSEISYSVASRGESQWGYDIAPGSLKYFWTKLELDQQERLGELDLILKALEGMKYMDPNHVQEAHRFPSHPARDSVDIVADYLTLVREYVRDHPLPGFHQAFFDVTPVDLVVTVPANWSDQAKDRSLRAISKAGFNQQNFPTLQDIILVGEAEAAALYTLKTQLEIEGDEFIAPGDCFVLCDAGGGTVDLISYRVKELLPFIQLEEIDIATGAKCGATSIDRGFMTWLKRRLGTLNFESLGGESPENAIGSHTVLEKETLRIMTAFQDIKHQFKGLGYPEESWIALPQPLNQEHDPARSIIDGELRITDQDLLDIFEPSIDKIIDLIQGQIGLVDGAGSRVRYVFLTGGFGKSEYLFNSVDEFTRLRGIKTKRPGPLGLGGREQEQHCLSAVMRGAVLRGLEKERGSPIYVRKCRRHYGVSVSEPFSSFKHLEKDSYNDPFDGEKKAQGQVNWFLKKGDALFSNESKHASIEICRKFGLHDPRIFRTNLLVLDDDSAPQRYADIPKNRMKVIELVYDLSPIPHDQFHIVRAGTRGQPYLCANLRLEVRLETRLEFKVICNEREWNVVANYD